MDSIALGGLLGVILLALVVLYFIGGSRLNRNFDIQVQAIPIPTDAASVQRGKHLVEAVAGCTECHGDKLGGKVFFEDPAIGRAISPNLTSGQGGVVASYKDVDFVRAIRHGVRPDGKGLVIMPAKQFHVLSDQDLGAVIAYVKSAPPVDNPSPPSTFTPLAHVLVAAGQFGEMVAATEIDHAGPRPQAPRPGVTAEYGKYLTSVAGCTGCHGADFGSGQSGEPGAPPAPNLTKTGNPGKWSEGDFIKTLRTGVRPDGRTALNPKYMPWPVFGKMTDDELKAVWQLLQSLPPKQ